VPQQRRRHGRTLAGVGREGRRARVPVAGVAPAGGPPEPTGGRALTLYSHRRGAWDESAYGAASVFAAHVAQALDAATVVSGLRVALRNRHEIGVAQGILMQRHGLTVAQSFDVLQRFSNTSNTKLSEVAGRIVRELDHA
jgi:hypothetical protein